MRIMKRLKRLLVSPPASTMLLTTIPDSPLVPEDNDAAITSFADGGDNN